MHDDLSKEVEMLTAYAKRVIDAYDLTKDETEILTRYLSWRAFENDRHVACVEKRT